MPLHKKGIPETTTNIGEYTKHSTENLWANIGTNIGKNLEEA